MSILESLNIISFNCNGLADKKKRKDVLDFLRTDNSSIYLLQETHWNSNHENLIRSIWGFECIVAGNDSASRGVAILFKNNFKYKIHRIHKDKEGRFIIVDIEVINKRVTLVNLYAPSSGDNPVFFQTLFDNLLAFQNEEMILAGDWNVALNPKLDSSHPSNIYKVRSRKTVLSFMNNNNVIDIFRKLNGDSRKYTWRRINGTQRSRIDFFLVSDTLGLVVKDVEVLTGYLSDHSIVKLKLKTDVIKRHKPLWKFNNSLLKDIQFVKTVKDLILKTKDQYAALVYVRENLHLIEDKDLHLTIDDQTFFEMLLLEIRGASISYASYKRKEQNEKEKTLLEEISTLEQTLSDIGLLEEKKRELFAIRQIKVDGMIIRSKAKWINDGEKCSKYFCNLEKRHYTDKSMPFLEKEDGNVTFNVEDITNEVKLFYEQLYASKEKDITIDIDSQLQCPRLEDEERNALEGEIKIEELLSAIKNLKNDKSPGSDGFTAEFFKFFYKDLSAFMLRSINLGFRRGEMSVTQKQGIIICIPKESKDKRFIKNWRPITLLNNIYKIASSCIAKRIKNVLPKLIHDDQKGFLKGRYIGENIRLMYDAIFYSELNNTPGLLLTIDFEKAFDSVAWSFIDKTLIKFNFGEDIRKWITTFYYKTTSCVYVNGQYSSWFDLHRGTRQGDPLSPYIFLLCAEIMSNMLRQNKDIKGLKIKNTLLLLSQFADDTAIFLDGDKQSFEGCIRVLQTFSSMSGLKINFDKCIAIWLGKNKNYSKKYCSHLNITWNPETFRYLGITFCLDLSRIVKENFKGKIEEIRKLLDSWSKRYLTPFGKITVLKCMAISKLNYLFMSLPDPDGQFLKELSSLFYDFLWSGKKDKIKREITIKPYESGGLKMIDVQCFLSALKITWLKRILLCNGKITELLLSEYPQIQQLNFRGSEFINTLLKIIKNPFWIDVLVHLKKLYYKCTPSTLNDFASERFHLNNHVTIGGKCIFFKKWIDNGIYCIGHLLNEGDFISFEQFNIKYPRIRVNFLTYEGIIRALKHYKNRLDINLKDEFVIGDSVVMKCLYKENSKYIYMQLINGKPSNCPEKWAKIEPIQFEVKTVFTKIFSTTSDPKLRWFQFRLLYRLIPTQRFLYLRKIINSPICNLCFIENQTIEHLFWECPMANRFWTEFNIWMKNNFSHCLNLSLSKRLILLGWDEKIDTDKVFDLFILLAKFYIYTTKLNNCSLLFTTFVQNIKHYFQIEKHNASLNGKSEEFKIKWTNYNTFFYIT